MDPCSHLYGLVLLAPLKRHFHQCGKKQPAHQPQFLGHFRTLLHPDGSPFILRKSRDGTTYKAIDTRLDQAVAYYIVTQLAEGEDLERYVARQGPLLPAEALRVVSQLAQARVSRRSHPLAPKREILPIGGSIARLRRWMNRQPFPMAALPSQPRRTKGMGQLAAILSCIAGVFLIIVIAFPVARNLRLDTWNQPQSTPTAGSSPTPIATPTVGATITPNPSPGGKGE